MNFIVWDLGECITVWGGMLHKKCNIIVDVGSIYVTKAMPLKKHAEGFADINHIHIYMHIYASKQKTNQKL